MLDFASEMKETMERLAQSAFARTFRAYLTNPDDPVAQQEIMKMIPKRSCWFLCEVDGKDYAIRVLPTGHIELMHSIFSQPRARSFAGITKHGDVLALPLFEDR